ncbi:MAG: hypothetical protein Q7Q71_01960 [Verrucomicrobiota bacterium JB023]|nr:hypothetical protein [Verrucomicrobiota bacterium JB023]
MANLDDMERSLERLMPRGMGDETRLRLEGVIDELAASTPPRMRRWPWALAASIVVALSATAMMQESRPEAGGAGFTAEQSEETEFELLEKGLWLEEGRDEGIQATTDDGQAMRAFSYVAIEEERLLHPQTGYTVVVQRELEGEQYFSTSL